MLVPGYAASAPVRFYAQEVQQDAYYSIISKSAERAHAGCQAAVRLALMELLLTPTAQVVENLEICTPLPPYLQVLPTRRVLHALVLALVVGVVGVVAVVVVFSCFV